MLHGLIVLGSDHLDTIYPESVQAAIREHVTFVAPPQTRESLAANPELMADVEVLFSGWGAPCLDEAFLATAPKLRAMFYGAGSVRGLVTDAMWDRGIVLTNANAANGVSVAEYTLGTILLSLKNMWQLALAAKREGKHDRRGRTAGNFESTVGIISLGEIGRRVARYLQPFDHRVVAYDPYVSAAAMAELGVEAVTLDELFAQSDVVSLHAPNLPATRNMITGAHIAAMRSGATFINTARGAIVDEPAMVAVLQARPDLTAVLDVTYPEPPVPESPLWTLPNVVLTPHIAGSVGHECARHGWQMVDELRLFVAGDPLQYHVTPERFAIMA